MRRRTRQNVPVFIAIAAVVLIVLVVALGSLGGGQVVTGVVSPTSEITSTSRASPQVPSPATLAQPTALPATPQPSGFEYQVIEDSQTGLKFVAGEVIVGFAPGVTVDLVSRSTSSAEVNAYLNSLPVSSFESLAQLPDGLSLANEPEIASYFKIAFTTNTKVVEIAEHLADFADVESASVNAVGQIDDPPDDPCYPPEECAPCEDMGQWALNDSQAAQLGIPRAWEVTTGSNTVVVAVLDTGIDFTHPDLRGKIAPSAYDFLSGRKMVVDDLEIGGLYGHGTETSGIIGALTNNGEGIAGTSWGAMIMPLKVCDSKGDCAGWAAAQAILWAGAQGADVVNMSFGVDGTEENLQMLRSAMNLVYNEHEVVMVASAGNDHQSLDRVDTSFNLPSEMDHVIVVGATNENDENCRPNGGLISLRPNNCGWGGKQGSGHGPSLDVMAPGSANICSTQPTYSWKEDRELDPIISDFGGTSASAPFVSGLAALMLSVNPDLTPDQIEATIKETAHHLGPEGDHDCGTNSPGNDDYGCGRIDVYAAVEAVAPPPPPVSGSGSTATMLVVDVSGSMGESWQQGVKIESAKSAANEIINMLQQESQVGGVGHRVGLATFTTTASLEFGLSADYDQARSTIARLFPLASTNIGDGLAVGNDALAQAGAGEKKIVILLSDGMTNTGLSPSGILSGPVKDAVNEGTCIYTVGFGDPGSLDEDLLRRIAAASGCGDYFYATDVDELEQVYIRVRHLSTGDLLAEFSGTVGQGQSVQAGTFEVPSGQGELAVTLHWPGSSLDLQLTDPRGRAVDENYQAASIVTYPNLVYAIIQQPVSGTWQAGVYGREVPEGVTDFDAIVSARVGAVAPPTSAGPGVVIILLTLVVGGVATYAATRRRPGARGRRTMPVTGPMLASLAITAGPLAGQTKSLTSQGILIGRGSGCDLRLVDRSVSRQHARLRYAEGAWFVQDLGSAAGTFVNGQRIQATRLNPGDQIQVGTSILVLTLPT